MKIGDLDLDERVMVVAEIGNNHEGDFGLAQELIGLAAEAGVDAVKFQTFRTQHYVARRDRRRFEQLRSFELTIEQFEHLSRVADDAGVLFLSTPLDLQSAESLSTIVAAYKIASGDNTFGPLLEAVARTGKPVIVSTGLASMTEIRTARDTIRRVWSVRGIDQELALLHCVTSYPVPPEEANLAAIGTLKAAFGGTIGYSDHTLGIDAAVYAVAAGARIVEKHFTVDKGYSEFRDHRLSADPKEMPKLVRRIRALERTMGSGQKVPQPCERSVVESLRRSIAAARDLPAGAILRREDLTWMRPGGGFAPGREDCVLGHELAGAVRAGQVITSQLLLGAPATVE